MGSIGLIYVGAVLIVNGFMLLGYVSGRGAAPLNLFVGLLQVLVPTVTAIQNPTADGIFAASGLYLFGFTYLWVAINNWFGLRGEGLGWFSLVVAGCAVFYAWRSFVADDAAFGLIWLMWAVLWLLFWLLLGLDMSSLAAATGVIAIVEGVITAAVPGLLLVSGLWSPGRALTTTYAVLGAAMLLTAVPLGRVLARREPVQDLA